MTPSRRRPPRGSNPMIAFDVTDLPEPDSPTMPIVLPRASVNEMSSTARTVPRGVSKYTDRLRTSSRIPPMDGSTPGAWYAAPGEPVTVVASSVIGSPQRALADVELLPQRVAQEVE